MKETEKGTVAKLCTETLPTEYLLNEEIKKVKTMFFLF